MTSTNSDLAKARQYLEMAEGELENLAMSVDRGRTAAAIGTGYAQLATIESRTALDETLSMEQVLRLARHITLECSTAGAHIRREAQAAEEARPHDGEPVNLCESDADAARRFAKQVGELTCRIDDALSWLDEPDDATPELQLAKIRAALDGEVSGRG